MLSSLTSLMFNKNKGFQYQNIPIFGPLKHQGYVENSKKFVLNYLHIYQAREQYITQYWYNFVYKIGTLWYWVTKKYSSWNVCINRIVTILCWLWSPEIATKCDPKKCKWRSEKHSFLFFSSLFFENQNTWNTTLVF